MMNVTFTGRRLLSAGILAGGVVFSACDTDSLLEVADPDRVRPDAITDSTALPAVRAGAIGDLQLAYAGSSGTEGQILQSALLSDEVYASGTFPTRIEVDRRDGLFRNATNGGLYLNVHRARRSLERAAQSYENLAPANINRAEMLGLASITTSIIGENYCSGVPFSESTDEDPFGEPLTTQQIFERALTRADDALAAAGENATFRNLARMARGRALLNLARYADAATAVAEVPTTFSYNMEHSANTGRQNNGVWSFSNNQGRFSVSNNEGGNGLAYWDDFLAGDTRIPNTRLTGAVANGFNTLARRQVQMKYPLLQSSAPLAQGIEARLIEAEAALQAGNTATFLTRLNDLRANTALYQCPEGAVNCTNATLAPLTLPGSQAEQVDLLFRERAYWLFLTSHRLGDLRRQMRDYGRTAAAAGFPTGSYLIPGATEGTTTGSGEAYGGQVALHVGIDELNNPKFAAAFPDGCNTETP